MFLEPDRFALLEEEVLEPLEPYSLRILQKKKGFRFGIDAVLLADFVRGGPTARCVDLGTGGGIIPLLLLGSGKAAQAVGVELQESYAQMAARCALLNRLQGRLRIFQGSVTQAPGELGGPFDFVTANPPYKEAGGGIPSAREDRLLARFEVSAPFSEFAACAGKLLKSKGRFYLVHRPERLCDVLCALRSARLEPKRIRFVHSYADKPPVLFLLESLKDGNPHLKFQPPLILYEKDGSYTPEAAAMYGDYHYEI